MIAFVQSPFQLLGVLEYPVRCRKIYVRFSDEQNDIQLQNAIKYLGFTATVVVLKKPISIMCLVQWTCSLIVMNFSSHKTLFGGSDSRLKYLILRRIELDDGLYSLKLIREGRDKKLFSFFKEDAGYSHRFKVLRDIIVSQSFNRDFKGDYLIGQPFVEANHCSKEDYIRVVGEIANSRPNLDTYIAHRTESDDKLQIIKALGLYVIRPDLPLELFFLKNRIMPNRVYGFNSTSLITLKILYEVSVVSIDWPHLIKSSTRPLDFKFATRYILDRADEIIRIK